MIEVNKDEWVQQEADAVQAVKDQFVGKYVEQSTLDYFEEIGKNYK